MPKVFDRVLAMARRLLRLDAREAGPQAYRQRKVGTGARQQVQLRLMLGASLGTVVIGGFTASSAMGEEACAFIATLRSPYTVERLLEQFPNDPCIPVMLSSIPPSLLARVSHTAIAALPPSQLKLLPKALLDEIGYTIPTTRSVPRNTTRTTRAPRPTTHRTAAPVPSVTGDTLEGQNRHSQY
jgi:hypothetical protein